MRRLAIIYVLLLAAGVTVTYLHDKRSVPEWRLTPDALYNGGAIDILPPSRHSGYFYHERKTLVLYCGEVDRERGDRFVYVPCSKSDYEKQPVEEH